MYFFCSFRYFHYCNGYVIIFQYTYIYTCMCSYFSFSSALITTKHYKQTETEVINLTGVTFLLNCLRFRGFCNFFFLFIIIVIIVKGMTFFKCPYFIILINVFFSVCIFFVTLFSNVYTYVYVCVHSFFSERL